MSQALAVQSPAQSYATSIIPVIFDGSDAASEYQPVAVAVQPRRHLQNQVDLLESKARLTSIRSSTVSAAESTPSQEPGPTLPTSPASQYLFSKLQSKPSSVLLREENADKSQLGTSSQSKTLRGQESSSTLHSFYDPQKLPLVVSQQTSESSSRDFALRKDCSPVVTPESQRKHFFENSKSRARAQSNEKRQRKERVDLSTLFPKPGNGIKAGNKRADNPPYYKMHVRRPKAGTKHWFDSYDDEASDEEGSGAANFEPEMHVEFAEGLGEAFMSLSSDTSPALERFPRQLTPPRSMPWTPDTSKSSRTPDIQAPLQLQRTHFPPVPRQRAPSIPTPRSIPKSPPVNPLHSANLKEQSVLFLSSDDEDEAPPLPITVSRQGTRMIGGLRESIAISTLDDADIEIGEARTVRSQPVMIMNKSPQPDMPKLYSDPGHPARMHIVVPDRRSSRMASFFAEESPSMRDSLLSGAPPSNSHRDMTIRSRTSRADVHEDSMVSLPVGHPVETELDWGETVRATPGLERGTSTQLMPVTRQEQALLTAMRSTKATMRRRSVHQEDSDRWQDESERDSFYGHRRGTSADTSAPAFVELGSNNYSEWMNRRRSSSMVNQYDGTRASVTTFATASQRASTRFSHYPFDETPNTPSSGRDSGLQRTSTGLGTHFSLSSGEFRGHSRSRTVSSHVVVLDHLSDSPKDLGNGVGSPRYSSLSYNVWSDGAGIPNAH